MDTHGKMDEKVIRMNTEANEYKQETRKHRSSHSRGASEAVYGLGMIGAWVYFISTATTFWLGVLGFLKGIVWPAFVVFEIMKFLNM